MRLNLTKVLCFFDLETTGIQLTKDRIVQLAAVKLFPDGHRESKNYIINPEMHIPEEIAAIHGITNEMVKTAPKLAEVAEEIIEFIGESDLAGYNSDRFDIPLLAEEMLRAGVDFDMKNRVSVDVQTIFHKKEERTLSAALKFYCGKTLENAHSAAADTMATYEILLGQLERYPDLQNDMKALSEFTTRKKSVDFAGMIVMNDKGQEMFSFGKYKNVLVDEVFDKDPGYFGWIQGADFPLYTKKVLTGLKLRRLNTK